MRWGGGREEFLELGPPPSRDRIFFQSLPMSSIPYLSLAIETLELERMLTPKAHFKSPSYISLPASLRTFITTPQPQPHVQPDHLPANAPIRKVTTRISYPLNRERALKHHMDDRSKDARNQWTMDYLKRHLAVFHSNVQDLTQEELGLAGVTLRRYAERLEWLKEDNDRKAGLHGEGKQKSIPASYYRGGTSRAVIMRTKHVPNDPATRRAFFLHIMGSPDPNGRQLNGMGAGVSSLSKICLVGRNRTPGADVDYTFVGVGIEGDETDYAGNCGNMSAAVGPFAWNEKMLGSRDYNMRDGEVEVMIYQTNTRKFIRSRFSVVGGQAKVDGNTQIDGVSGMGTGVVLDFLNPEGSKTSGLLPTGHAVDTLCGVEASCVDAANPCVFVRAEDVGLDPTILPNDFAKEKDTLALLERIRTAGAVAMGLCNVRETPPRVIPKIGIVNPPVESTTLSGARVPADLVDLVVRFISDGQPHRAIPVTAALCTAAAAKTEGSIVQQCMKGSLVDGNMITIGHPSGRIQVNAQKDQKGRITSCALVRTARRIWDGRIYWSEDPNLLTAKEGGENLANEVFMRQGSEEASEEELEPLEDSGLSKEAIQQLKSQLEQVEKDLHNKG